MTVCEQTTKPIGLHLPEECRARLGLPRHFAWYVGCPRYSGWDETLDEAIQNWRTNRLSRQTFRHKDEDE